LTPSDQRVQRRAAVRWMLASPLALYLGLGLGALGGCDRKAGETMVPGASAFKGVDITGANYGKVLALPDASGSPRDLKEFQGKVVVLFFGYTQCPDVCPTTMAELAEVRRRLGPQGQLLQGVFVSVDPERDTGPVLGEYIKAIDPSFVALRGTAEQISQVAREFKVVYQKVPTQDGQSYTMDHTAGSYIIDPKGQLRLFERYGTKVDDLLSDIKQLLAEKG
jgi:protein SCO1